MRGSTGARVEWVLEPPALNGALLILEEVVGRDWIGEQLQFPEHKRHPIAKWFGAPLDLPITGESPERVSFRPSGNFQEVKALAIDIALLRQVGKLPADLVARLKVRREYQGVRYELAVAAWFVRMSLLPIWNREKGPEFFVDLPGTDCRVAVEAKARRRSGYLGFPGKPEASLEVGDVEKLFKEACRTDAHGCPLLIFIDLNGPDEPDLEPAGHPAWVQKTKSIVRKFENGDRQALFAMVVFTNIAWHFAGQQTVNSLPPVHFFVPPNSIMPLRYELRDRLTTVMTKHGTLGGW